jgi:hypothetical protein
MGEKAGRLAEIFTALPMKKLSVGIDLRTSLLLLPRLPRAAAAK